MKVKIHGEWVEVVDKKPLLKLQEQLRKVETCVFHLTKDSTYHNFTGALAEVREAIKQLDTLTYE